MVTKERRLKVRGDDRSGLEEPAAVVPEIWTETDKVYQLHQWHDELDAWEE